MERDIKLKQLALAESIAGTADSIGSILKRMPRNGKKGRNIFIKTYNRRPGNKKKRGLAFANLALSAVFGAIDLYKIMQTPVPRYPLGDGSTVDKDGLKLIGKAWTKD